MKNYKIIAEALANGQMKEIDLPTERLNIRKLSLDEIVEAVKKEFEDVKDVEKEAAKVKEDDWCCVELPGKKDWAKELNLKEWFEIIKK